MILGDVEVRLYEGGYDIIAAPSDFDPEALEKALNAKLRNSWMTPRGVLRGALDFLRIDAFDLDLAGPDGGSEVPCRGVITEEIDALSFDWPGGDHWLNFPFMGGRGHKDMWADYAIAQVAKNPDLVVAFYGPYYGDMWAARLDAASVHSFGVFPRVAHIPPLGLKKSSPQQHAHKTWILAGSGREDTLRAHAEKHGYKAWNWREERWL